MTSKKRLLNESAVIGTRVQRPAAPKPGDPLVIVHYGGPSNSEGADPVPVASPVPGSYRYAG